MGKSKATKDREQSVRSANEQAKGYGYGIDFGLKAGSNSHYVITKEAGQPNKYGGLGFDSPSEALDYLKENQ